MSEMNKICKQWKKGKGRGYKRFTKCSTCYFAGYGVCLAPYEELKQMKYKKEGYNCPYCEAIFPKPQSLGGHVTRVHTTADLDLLIAMKKKEEKAKT